MLLAESPLHTQVPQLILIQKPDWSSHHHHRAGSWVFRDLLETANAARLLFVCPLLATHGSRRSLHRKVKRKGHVKKRPRKRFRVIAEEKKKTK